MLFNSPEFLFLFLPATIVAFALFGSTRRSGTIVLIVASLIFYEQWSFKYLLLLIGLMSMNFLIGQTLLNAPSKLLLSAGIIFNLSILGYFKYSGFFFEQLLTPLGFSASVTSVMLPLGISFFTFQKIAYLVDCYRKQTPPHTYVSFSLFVLFFPQLIAGPITHAREIVPQIAKLPTRILAGNLAIGMTILIIGLCKKMLIADNIGPWVNTTFAGAPGTDPTLITAWLVAIGFGLQIYFDFSGYSDMAIGLARIFGIHLPVNFDSPYKSLSITDFWRRWHITLSRFLRDYLYIPLGGNRGSAGRQYGNLLITMTLGGLWHGAGWTFLVWGALHGGCLIVHKLWTTLVRWPLPHLLARSLTFLVVILLWVPFRAPSLDATLSIWFGMLGLNGIALPASLSGIAGSQLLFGFIEFRSLHLDLSTVTFWIPLALCIVFLAPNTQEIMGKFGPQSMSLDGITATRRGNVHLSWKPTLGLGIVFGIALAGCILKFNDISEFVYFQF